MNRRNFLQALAGAVGALFAGRAVTSVEPAAAVPDLPPHALDGAYHSCDIFAGYLRSSGFVMDGDVCYEHTFVVGSNLREGEAVYLGDDGRVYPCGVPIGIATSEGIATSGTVISPDPTLHAGVFVAEKYNPC